MNSNNTTITRISHKKGEEIFKINENKSFGISNIISIHRINQVKPKKIKLSKNGKNEIINKNKENILEDEELTNLAQRRTFIETNSINNKTLFNNYMDKIAFNRKNKFFYSFVKTNANPVNKNIVNKNKILIRNKKNYKNSFLTLSSSHNPIKKNSTTLITLRKKNTENLLFINKLKKRKEEIETYNNNKRINQENNINNTIYGIAKIIPKKINGNKKVSHKNTNNLHYKTTVLKGEKKGNQEKKEKKEEKKEYNFILDIESEHEKSINKLKIEEYNINKPNEYKMKFSFYNEYKDDENDVNDKNKGKEFMIGKIEGYKDIIESDKNNFKNHINKINKIKNKLYKESEKKVKENNNLKNMEGFSIFDENFSEFNDLNILNNFYCKTNQNLENIENGYEFEDLSTYEYENKINKNKLMLFKIEK